ncbi:META domain-containing protein [Rhodobacterales bacterium HKCCSP123]|nr:META domain-containing protein [Rhodobacterales bacterium HKCCSP123]
MSDNMRLIHRFSLAAAVLLCSSGWAVAQADRVLSGSVTYRDRMALAPDAILLIEVADPGGALLAEARIPTEGRQVPIPFAVTLPDGGEGTLRAGLAVGGQVIWLGDPVPVTAGAQEMDELVLPRFEPMGFATAVRCGDSTIQLGFADGAAVMDTGTARLMLQPAPAASGARYEMVDDPATWLWTRGDSALVSIGGAELPECRIALPLDPTPYDAGGNEPFWSLLIDAGQMRLSRLGMEDLVLPVTEAALTGEGDIRVTAAEGALGANVLRRAALCRDTMSGLPHPETVEISMGDDTLSGCGGDPWALLTGRTWVVEDIGGAGVIDGARAAFGFEAAGRVYGAGSCNRFHGAVELTGEGLRFGPLASTMMACPDAIMDQERRMFDAMAEVYAFDIDDSGALILFGPSGPVITARAATDGSQP